MGAATSEHVLPLPFGAEGPVTNKEEGSAVSKSAGLAWAFSSMQGWRPRQEDAHVCLGHLGPKGGQWGDTALFAVFDGHGGEEVARFCERHLPGELLRHAAADPAAALTGAFSRMDQRLWTPHAARELRSLSRAPSAQAPNPGLTGCTAAVCMVRPTSIVVANAGDSRAVLCRGGKAIELSSDHKPGQPRERRRIEQAGGRVINQQYGPVTIQRIDGCLSVSRAIGDLNFKSDPRLAPQDQRVSAEPDITEVARTPNDEFMVVACDGVWDVMSSQQVCNFIRHHLDAVRRGALSPAKLVSMLLDSCLAASPDMTSGTDNMTLVLVIFTRPVEGRALFSQLAAAAGLDFPAPVPVQVPSPPSTPPTPPPKRPPGLMALVQEGILA